MSNQIDEMSRAIGRIEQKVDSLSESFNRLPCSNENNKIDVLEDKVSKIEGKISIISAVSGFIGSIIFAIVSWFLSKIKL